jgi:hypothetical protein
MLGFLLSRSGCAPSFQTNCGGRIETWCSLAATIQSPDKRFYGRSEIDLIFNLRMRDFSGVDARMCYKLALSNETHCRDAIPHHSFSSISGL